jgi:hypothetical protein
MASGRDEIRYGSPDHKVVTIDVARHRSGYPTYSPTSGKQLDIPCRWSWPVIAGRRRSPLPYSAAGPTTVFERCASHDMFLGFVTARACFRVGQEHGRIGIVKLRSANKRHPPRGMHHKVAE